MRDRIAGGVPAAEAARRTLDDLPHGTIESDSTAERGSADPFADLREAIERFDGAAAHRALDRLSRLMSVDSLLTHGVAPFLAEESDSVQPSDLGDARARFATPLLRGRLLERARDWSSGSAGTVLLACAPDQHSDVGLICTGVALSARGWRVVFLGADVRIHSISAAAEAVAPDAVLVDVRSERSLVGLHEQLRELAGQAPLYLSCEGMTAAAARALGARLLSGDAVRAARRLAGELGR